MARAGRLDQAGEVLREAAAQPAAVAAVHENLAAVERRLGQRHAAAVAESRALSVATAERSLGAVSQRHGVVWAPPSAFGARSAPGPMISAPSPPPTEPGSWDRFVDYAKRKTGWATETPPTFTASQPPTAQQSAVR